MHSESSNDGLIVNDPDAQRVGSWLLRWLLCLVVPLSLTFFAWTTVSKSLRQRAQSDFEVLARENERALTQRISSYAQAIQGVAGFVQASAHVTRDEWRVYVKSLDIVKNHAGMRGISYVQEVRPEDVDAFLKGVREDGAPEYAIHPPTEGKPLFVVVYCEPLKGREGLLGLNLAFEENRLQAALRARDLGAPTLTDKLILTQDKTKSPGFVLLMPVYHPAMPLETIQDRRAAFHGWVFSTFLGGGLLTDLTESQGETLGLSVYDGAPETPDSFIYSDRQTESAAPVPAFSVRKQIRLMQQTWSVAWTSTPSFEAAHRSNEPFLVLLGGLMLTSSICLFVAMSVRRTKTIEQRVVEKTKEVAANENQLKLLIRHTPAAVAMFDTQMRYIMTSERWLEDYGLQGRDILGKSHYEIFPEILKHGEWLEHHRRALNGQSLAMHEDCWERSDGRTEWVKWALHPWVDVEGQIGGLVMFTEVITERKEAERRSELLREIAIDAANAPTVAAVLEVAMHKICGYLRWPMAHGNSWRADRHFYDVEQIWHTESVERALPETYQVSEAIAFALKNRLAGRVIAEGKPILVVAPLPRAAIKRERFFFQSCLSIPVFVGKRVVAVLNFLSPDICPEDKALLAFCELVALQLSRVIERKEVEAALKESEDRFDRAVQGSSVGLWEWDIRSQNIFLSARFMEITGNAPKNCTSDATVFLRLLHPEDRARLRAAIIAHIKRRKPFDVEYRLLRANGDYRWIHSRGQATWGADDRALLMAGSADDITDRKRTEGALEESNRLTTTILASTTSLVIATGPDGRVELFNKAAEWALGYSAADVVSKPLPPIWDRDEMATRAMELSREYGEIVEPGFEVFARKARLHGAEFREWTFIRKNGARIPVHLTTTPLIGANDEIGGFLCVADDITERLAQREA